MIDDGFIKIHRRALASWLWTLPAPQFKVAMTMLLLANWKDGEMVSGGQLVDVPRGSFVTSLKRLAEHTVTESVRTIRTSLSSLARRKFLSSRSTNRFRVISIMNYGRYQDVPNDSDKQSDKPATSQRQASDNDRRKKEGKKGRRAAPKSGTESIHNSEASRLWNLQEQLRKEVSPRCHLRPPTPDRIKPIIARLAGGATAEECEMVLTTYRAEAEESGDCKWFNGETNWRSANFERALGKGPSSVNAQPSLPPGFKRL